jgi:uncharacterized DUF497 family protein
VNISYDPGKNEKNIAERGISFERAAEFEWSNSLIVEDTRKDYDEPGFKRLDSSESGCTYWCSLRAQARCTLSACAKPTDAR